MGFRMSARAPQRANPTHLAGRAVVMHGHRHIDWIGTCGRLKIISAPSPVMNATDDATTYFYVHTLTAGPDGRLDLLPPERVEIAGEKESQSLKATARF